MLLSVCHLCGHTEEGRHVFAAGRSTSLLLLTAAHTLTPLLH